MITIRQCYPEHIMLINPHRRQRFEMITPQSAKVAEHGIAQSIWIDHHCVWAGGIFEKWQDVGMGWALFGEGSYSCLDAITDCARDMIFGAPYKRVEITVEPDFKAGHRWMRRLGMSLEAPLLRCYGPGGRDMALYAHIRGV